MGPSPGARIEKIVTRLKDNHPIISSGLTACYRKVTSVQHSGSLKAGHGRPASAVRAKSILSAFQCRICLAGIKSQSRNPAAAIAKHVKRRHPEAGRPFSQHVIAVNPERFRNIRLFQCQICFGEIKSQSGNFDSAIMSHVKRKHPEAGRPLSQHVTAVNPEQFGNIRLFQCQICFMEIKIQSRNSNRAIIDHVKKNHPEAARPYTLHATELPLTDRYGL